MYGVEKRLCGVEERPFDSRMGVQAYTAVPCSFDVQTFAAEFLRSVDDMRGVCRIVGARAHHLGTPVM